MDPGDCLCAIGFDAGKRLQKGVVERVRRVSRNNCPHVIVGPSEPDLEVEPGKAILNRVKVGPNCVPSSPQ